MAGAGLSWLLAVPPALAAAFGWRLSPVTLVAFTFQPLHINRPIAFCRVLKPVMPSPPASTTAHDPLQILPRSFGKMPYTLAEAISGPLRGFPLLLASAHLYLPSRASNAGLACS